MKERTLQILQALVQDFIETANPVASKRLLESHHLKISSATIRNEFALLEEVGLVKSPHISAGKIPTEKGYRFFVDQFLENQTPNEEKIITDLFTKRLKEYKFQKSKETVIDALRILSQLSGNVAFANLDNDQTFYIGLSKVLRSPEFLHEPEMAAQIVEILEGRTRFQDLLQSLDLPTKTAKIFIGKENLLEEISSCAMLVIRFSEKNISGTLGILGPMRMQYSFNKLLLQNAVELIF
ncbi:hypothetical protein KAI58_00420 [Candidatus Gracilibacteria bacterium]|nr:hypothetical protein [Candidatus Gracilibacteria bacterium]